MLGRRSFVVFCFVTAGEDIVRIVVLTVFQPHFSFYFLYFGFGLNITVF